MERMDFTVSLSPRDAAEKVKAAIEGSFSGKRKDEYCRRLPDGRESVFLLLEKYYLRVGNRAALAFLADDFEGKTKVHLSAGGCGQGLFSDGDFGAGAHFATLIKNVLRDFMVE